MKNRLIFLAIVLIGILGIATVQAQDQKIIDVHLHSLELDMLPAHWDTIVGHERPVSAEALRSQTIEQLERFNITKAITSGDAERLKEWKNASPDRIIRSQWIPWDIKGDSLRAYLDSLPRWHEQGRFQMIGEVLTQYSEIAPADRILDPLWEFAEKEGVPVGIHINDLEGTCPESFKEGCTPLAMKEVLDAHPNLKAYIMHAGYPHLEDMIELLENYPQVYVGATFTNPKSEEYIHYLEGLVEPGHTDRIMFGSDQMLWPELIGNFVHVTENADFLTEQQKNAIFYDNAARFFELNTAEE